MGQRLFKLLIGLTVTWNLVVTPGASLAYAPQDTNTSLQAEEQDALTNVQLNPYRAEFVSQNGFPQLLSGQSYQFIVTVKNSGQAGWRPDTVHLGTDQPQDRVPRFIREGDDPSGWIAPNRVEMAGDPSTGKLLGDTNGNDIIDAGEQATFKFWYTVPETLPDGVYHEYFNVVADGIRWLNDLGIYWDVTVDNLPHSRWVEQNPYPPTLKAGQFYEFWVRFENTGRLPWRADGSTPVHLGTDRPMDRVPSFVREGPAGTASGWVVENRIELERDPVTGNLIGDVNDNNQIDQGEIARFRFWYTVPSTMESGVYREYFRPVMDFRGEGWMEDDGVYWEITVDNIAPRPATVTVTPLTNHLAIDWSPVTEATSYKVHYRSSGSEVFAVLDFPPTVTKANIDVAGGADYEVGVASVDAEGVSPFTSQVVHVESPEEVQARLARAAARQAALEEERRLAEEQQAVEEPEPPVVTGAPAEEPGAPRDWRSFWLTLLILLGAAGLATAGYYGYEWYAESRERPGPPRRPEPPRQEPPRREPPRREEPPSQPPSARW